MIVQGIDPGGEPGFAWVDTDNPVRRTNDLWLPDVIRMATALDPADTADVFVTEGQWEPRERRTLTLHGFQRSKPRVRDILKLSQRAHFLAGLLAGRWDKPAYCLPPDVWRGTLDMPDSALVCANRTEELLTYYERARLAQATKSRKRQVDVLAAIGIAWAWYLLAPPKREQYLETY